MDVALTVALVVWPLVAAAALAICPPRWIGGGATAALLVELALAGLAALAADTWRLALRAPWLPATGSDVRLAIDGLNLCLPLALAAALAVAVASDDPSAVDRRPARIGLAFAATGGLTLFLLARDLVLAAAGHGLAGLALAALVGLGAGRGAAAAGRFGTWAAAGTLALLAAAGVASAQAGTTAVDEVGAVGAGPWAAALLLLALAAQTPLVPCHTWLVPVGAAAAGAGRVLVLGAWSGVGVVGVARLALAVCPAEAEGAAPWLVAWGTLSAGYGAILALAQGAQDLLRRAAWAAVCAGGAAVAGAAAFDLLPALGAVALATAHVPLRAALVALAARAALPGGRAVALAWTAAALAFVAAPGAGAFPGWLLLITGSSTWVGAGLLAALALSGLALLLPLPGLAGGNGPALARPLIWSLGLVGVLTVATGLRPGPFVDRAQPEVEDLLARPMPGIDLERDAGAP